MSLHARVSRVDDYAGELTQALKKLEIEQGRGALDLEQQTDFLADLRKAVELRDLRPMRNRVILDLSAMVLILVLGAILIFKGTGFHHLNLYASLFLAILLCNFALTVWRFNLYLRRRRHDQRWLANLEAAVSSGGNIFDTH